MGTHGAQRDRVRPFLKNNTFLRRLPDVVLDALLRKGQVRRFAKGEFAYRRGDRGDSLIVVIEGRIKLTNTNMGGKEVVLHYVGVGDIFGEIAALDGKERAADAVALEDSEVFAVYRRDLMPTLAAHPRAMQEILQALCEKVRAGASIIEDNALKLRGRTARGLLRLAGQHGQRSADGTSLQLTISQEELGKYLRISRSNVNRQLGQLRTANMIRISGTEISIIDEKGLSDIVQDRKPMKPLSRGK
jgi:CRP/FNR family cyclic AMP-dependent transcriptional regulator